MADRWGSSTAEARGSDRSTTSDTHVACRMCIVTHGIGAPGRPCRVTRSNTLTLVRYTSFLRAATVHGHMQTQHRTSQRQQAKGEPQQTEGKEMGACRVVAR